MINVYTTISDMNGVYDLSALLIDGKYTMPALSKKGANDSYVFIWNNPSFLYGDLLDMLEFRMPQVSIIADIPISDFGTVLALLLEGKNLSFDKCDGK